MCGTGEWERNEREDGTARGGKERERDREAGSFNTTVNTFLKSLHNEAINRVH